MSALELQFKQALLSLAFGACISRPQAAMAAPMVLDSTTVQPTETQGLPAADDKVVRELDVYVLKETLGQDAQASGAAAAGAGARAAAGPSPVFLLRWEAGGANLNTYGLPPRLQAYLLQFPLRPPWRPYHTDHQGLQNVKLKPKVRLAGLLLPRCRQRVGLTALCQPFGLLNGAVLKSQLHDVLCWVQVKKLQADVPLDTTSRNYNDNVEPSRRAAADG